MTCWCMTCTQQHFSVTSDVCMQQHHHHHHHNTELEQYWSASWKRNISSVESQKAAININKGSVENQKGAIALQSLYGVAPLWFSTKHFLNSDSALLARNWRNIEVLIFASVWILWPKDNSRHNVCYKSFNISPPPPPPEDTLSACTKRTLSILGYREIYTSFFQHAEIYWPVHLKKKKNRH